MATITNNDLLINLRTNAKILNAEKIPEQLAEKIVPTLETNPAMFQKCNFWKGDNKATSGALAIVVTDSNKDTYLTGMSVHFTKDAACDIATGSMNITFILADGLGTSYVLSPPVLTLTAERADYCVSFNQPLKLTKGTTISYAGTYTAGLMSRSLSVWGYTVDPKV